MESKSKVGSTDNMKHKPGGGNVKVGSGRGHPDLEREVGGNKIPQKKMSADHECMKCRDVKNVYRNSVGPDST